MAEHTPGPWKWHWREEGGLATGSVFAEPRQGHAYAIAMTPRYQKREQWAADARLIAAAPNLLKALQDIAGIENEDFGPDWDEIERARNIAHAALAIVYPPEPATDNTSLPSGDGQ